MLGPLATDAKLEPIAQSDEPVAQSPAGPILLVQDLFTGDYGTFLSEHDPDINVGGNPWTRLTGPPEYEIILDGQGVAKNAPGSNFSASTIDIDPIGGPDPAGAIQMEIDIKPTPYSAGGVVACAAGQNWIEAGYVDIATVGIRKRNFEGYGGPLTSILWPDGAGQFAHFIFTVAENGDLTLEWPGGTLTAHYEPYLGNPGFGVFTGNNIQLDNLKITRL